MTRVFQIITEADARQIERGTTVELAKGGHVTPLAADTLRERRVTVVPAGSVDPAIPVDYPDTAASVAKAVARGEADAGIVIDGAGIGSAIAANKVRGIRAVMVMDDTIARYSREHNGANVMTLGSTLLQVQDALRLVD